MKCQFSKALPPKPLPLQPILATKPWEMVGVDVLKVPMSIKGNQYLLVTQNYFSKWPFVKPTYARSENSDYCEQLKTKLTLLREMVDTNLVELAGQQQHAYEGSVRIPLKSGQC